MTKHTLLFYCFYLFSLNALAQIDLSIHQIQGDGLSSPYAGQLVRSDSNIVTSVSNNGFFIQSAPSRTDNDPLTSEGLYVYLGNSSGLNPGDMIHITGFVQEYQGETEIAGTATNWEWVASGQPLPEAVVLDRLFPSAQLAAVPELERLEGMRVRFSDAIICAPGDANNPAGFYLSDQRPFREAGIIAPGIPGLPVWDNNPELIFFDAGYTGGTNLRLSSGMILSAEGILSVADDHYLVLPQTYDLQGALVDRWAREKETTEVSIGCLNALFLDSDSDPDNIIHRQQIAIYIVDGMKGPDIVALQEVENLAAMNDVASRVNQLKPELQYDAFLLQANSSSINQGFLVNRQSIINAEVKQLGKSETLSVGGTKHDRPPLLLTADFVTDPPTPIQVLNVHLKSLIGIEGSNQEYVRTKRHEAAISVAQMVQNLQNDNLVVVGDFNAFPFSDGYVDVVNQISGQNSLGAERPVLATVDPPLTNQSTSTLVDVDQQYSYVYRGNAQLLDHCLTNDLQGLIATDLQYVRGNADNPELYVNNPLTPQFSSDHDGFVLYLQLQDSLISVGNHSVYSQAKVIFPNPFPTDGQITFIPAENGNYYYKIRTVEGRLMASSDIGVLANGEQKRFDINGLTNPGIYILEINGPSFRYSGKMVVLN